MVEQHAARDKAAPMEPRGYRRRCIFRSDQTPCYAPRSRSPSHSRIQRKARLVKRRQEPPPVDSTNTIRLTTTEENIMGQHATKAPAVIDWPLMQRTELTLSLSRRGLTAMPADLAARRILAALHEAAHLIAAVQYAVPVYRVFILGTRGQRTVAGVNGGVVYAAHDDIQAVTRFSCRGCARWADAAGGGDVCFCG